VLTCSCLDSVFLELVTELVSLDEVALELVVLELLSLELVSRSVVVFCVGAGVVVIIVVVPG
jgi:hypothetical protein